MPENVVLSVIVPMYNAASTIDRVLAPLLAMHRRGEIAELIVADDCSTDVGVGIARAHPEVVLMRMETNGGPGAARNHAAGQATGSHLWFVDSDVVVAEDSATVLKRVFSSDRADAVFGCYDDAPSAGNFLSQYKNLVHRYYHARSNRDAATFWAGCGAVDRLLFLEVGGFDAARFPHPSIEDIELGYRILDAGRVILLEPTLQGKHLKEWRFRNLLFTEVRRRAMPWARLMFESGRMTHSLNLGFMERIRAIAAAFSVLLLALWGLGAAPTALVAALLGGLILLNLEFIAYFVRRRGTLFAIGAFAYHQFYYLYSMAAFATAWMLFRFGKQDKKIA